MMGECKRQASDEEEREGSARVRRVMKESKRQASGGVEQDTGE